MPDPTNRAGRIVPIIIVMVLQVGCAGLQLDDELGHLPQAEYLESVPFHPQTAYHCGPAALATVLEHSGAAVDYDQLVDRVYIPGRGGSLQPEMIAAVRAHDLIAYLLPTRPEAVFREVAAGRPVLVFENLGLKLRPVWHFAVVVGYDGERNQVIERSGEQRELRVGAGRWLRRWDRAGRWAMVTLNPGEWPTQPERRAWLQAVADFEAHTDTDTALKVWRQTLERWPGEPIALLGVGNAHFARDEFDQAVRAYRRLLESTPDHAAGRFNLAATLEEAGSPCEAAKVYARLRDHAQLGERARQRLVGSRQRCLR